MNEEYYAGLSLGASAAVESGIAVLDRNNILTHVDKLFSVNDIIYFLKNFHSLKNSIIMVSLPWDNTMLNGKWRVLSKPYQRIHETQLFLNTDNWMQRFSPRASEYFSELRNSGININRYEIYLTRQKLNLYSNYKERSPADCKFFQSMLKVEHGFELPNNMMPAAQLEAVAGAMLAREHSNGRTKCIFEYKGLPVINKI